MASHKFHRWNNALKQCMDAKKKGGREAVSNRWRGDPLMLNQEAHEMPAEKQRQALDMAEEAPAELREQLAPMWKYCFVQWHIYDAGLEAIEKGKPLRDGFGDELLLKDVESLRALFESGDLEKAKPAEKWTWKLLEPFPAAGSAEPWNDDTSAPMLQAGRQERKEGVAAFAEEQFERAFFHFWQGLKLLARAPPSLTGPHAKLRCDLYKNKAAAALKLKLGRVALRSATFAVAIDRKDPKAWYRKSCALELLGEHAEAKAAMAKAGLEKPEAAKEHSAATAAVLSPALNLSRRDAWDEDGDLPPRHHARLESIVFIEVGIDSIAALDMIRHLQSELPDLPIPLTLVFDYPTVDEATSALLGRLNAASEDDPYMRARMNNTMWRAMCRALGTDPVKGVLEGRLGHVTWPEISEQEAREALSELKRAYEEEAFAQSVRQLAKRVAFEQRAFLVNLRALALEVQRPILEARGFDGDVEGLRRLEAAVLGAVARAEAPAVLRELLLACRVAQQGGPNGVMWTMNMEANEGELWADCHSLQSWSSYVKADPFGPGRKNTNSVVSVG